jgi:hypothetical protein
VNLQLFLCFRLDRTTRDPFSLRCFVAVKPILLQQKPWLLVITGPSLSFS